ncbi:hypothetical protein [Kitasatospora phosalacinea]|uniref:hypothetical protein n=1 Tax=Kitasatospora phosalacinea TaxID=2065 RepID=UPI00068FA2D5
MLGLLGIGAALVAGVALRPAAVAGTLLLAMVRTAEWPPARHLAGGAPSGSDQPGRDHHLVYALPLVALAAARAGDRRGPGRWRAARSVVRARSRLR